MKKYFPFPQRCVFQVIRGMSTSSKFTEKKASVKGININYVEAGSGPKSVLLLPGALGSAWNNFKPQIEKLPEVLPGHTLIAWDPPGYGKSIPPRRTFGLDFFKKDAEYAKALMDTLGRSKFSILGWSDGGITGMLLSGIHVDSVEKLVIWGANAYLNKDEVEILEGLRDVQKWSPKMREPMEEIYGAAEFAKLWSEWVDGMICIYNENNGNFCKEEVTKIQAPTFLIHGKKDPMVHPEHIPYLRNHIKGVKYYEFPEGKHNIHLRYADEFNKLVADFLLNKSSL